MNSVFQGLELVFAFVDDVLIASEDIETQFKNVAAVMDRLKKFGLRCSLKKCEWMKDEVEFLGILITSEGLQPKADKVETIKTWPRSTSYKRLRSIISMFSFNRQHVPHYAEIVEPLQLLPNEGQSVCNSQVSNDTILQWDTIHDEASSNLTKSRTCLAISFIPRWNAHTYDGRFRQGHWRRFA